MVNNGIRGAALADTVSYIPYIPAAPAILPVESLINGIFISYNY